MKHAVIDPLESRRLLSTVSFLIDSDLSALRIQSSARISVAGKVKMNAQDDGLDAAALMGSMRVDLTPKGVRLIGGNVIDAVAHEGDFEPNDEDADFAVDGKLKKYGVRLATVKAAIRDLVLDVTGSSRKAVAGDGRFPLRHAEMAITDGEIDYLVDSRVGDADGSKSLSGLKTDLENAYGSLTGSPGSRTLTLPLDVEYKRKFDNDSSATFRLKGVVVAHEVIFAEAQIAPESPAKSSVKTRVADDVL